MDEKKLEILYKEMLRIRMVEEAIAQRYSLQKMRCPTHLSIGQEAVAVGISSILSLSDKVYSSHRAHAHYLAKGGCLIKLIAELHGKSTGCTGGRGGSMHLCDLDAGFMASTAIVANSIPLATGHALHCKNAKDNNLVVAYFGEGATEEGAFYEAVNFAAVKSLPIIFVCENNRYSVYSPLKSRQPPCRSIVQLSRSMGIRSELVNGNDVISVQIAAEMAREHVLEGKGPILLECETYRHLEHCGPNWDDDLNYRPKQEVEYWMKNDPIELARSKLKLKINASDFKEKVAAEIDQAFLLADSAPFPSCLTINNNLYA